MRSFEWFIAWRYLFSRERRALVSVITLISMAGVAVGVAALIVVIGVMDGADKLLFGKIADIYPHLKIEARRGEELAIDPEWIDWLESQPGVEKVQPIIQKQVLIQAKKGIEAKRRGIQVTGLNKITEDNLYNIPLKKAQKEAGGIPIAPREIMLGAPLMSELETYPGEKIYLMGTNAAATGLGAMAPIRAFEVIGYFTTGFYEFDANTAFVNEKRLADMSSSDGVYDYIHVKLADPWDADALKASLRLDDYRVTTWSESNGAFFSALKLEKLGLFLILMLIILVAAFNIIGTLILMVIEKTREIGILKAIGATHGLIMRVFLTDGILIGLVGTVVGVLIGVVLCLLIPLVKIPMPPSIYNFDHLPVQIKAMTVTMIVACSLLVCTLAALFPAWQAARLDPVEALRHD